MRRLGRGFCTMLGPLPARAQDLSNSASESGSSTEGHAGRTHAVPRGEAFGSGVIYAVALDVDIDRDADLTLRKTLVRRAQDDLRPRLDDHPLELVRRFELVSGLAVRVVDEASLEALRQDRGVRAVGPDEGGVCRCTLPEGRARARDMALLFLMALIMRRNRRWR